MRGWYAAAVGWWAAGVAVAQSPAPPTGAEWLRTALQDRAGYAVSVRHAVKEGGAEAVEARLTSQAWKGTAWKHRLFVVRPAKVAHPRQALLFIGGGVWRPAYDDPAAPPDAERLRSIGRLAEQQGTVVAYVEQVPHQPLFGRVEDDAISYTFAEFLRTGDASWPLVGPMAKAAVRAMDAAQQITREQWGQPVERFVVTGASKRGWTTYLAAAADKRVIALAPQVFDVLNMVPQMEHQLASFGTYSEMIGDYTGRGLVAVLPTPPGQALQRLVDPYRYKDKLLQPKLVILGTNDRYWPLDAARFYADDLPGETRLLYVPNNGHGLNDPVRVYGSIAVLQEHAAAGRPLPKLTDGTEGSGGGRTLTVAATARPDKARVWVSHHPARDFRKAAWAATEVTPGADGGFRHAYAVPAEGYTAAFAEAEFVTASGRRLFLSTLPRVTPDIAAKPPAAPAKG